MARTRLKRIDQTPTGCSSNVIFSPIWPLLFSIVQYPEKCEIAGEIEKVQSSNNKLTVSSFQMAFIWVPSIIIVNTANSKASKIRNNKNITVAGGEKFEHSRHSLLMH
jgi:hypothetical protein